MNVDRKFSVGSGIMSVISESESDKVPPFTTVLSTAQP